MFAITILGLVAAAAAAPHYYHLQENSGPPPPGPPPPGPPPPHYHQQYHGYDPYLFNSFESEIARLHKAITALSSHIPAPLQQEAVVGNNYIITVSLPGFEDKNIAVKARAGIVLIQANGNVMNYQSIRTLPSNVNPAGSYIYADDVLKITLPLIKKHTTENTSESQEADFTTIGPDQYQSREEMGTDDGGEPRGDIDFVPIHWNKQHDILTNEIPNINRGIEDTTQDEHLKTQYEFVEPMN